MYEQRVGRAVRFGSHLQLPEAERSVEVHLYVARLSQEAHVRAHVKPYLQWRRRDLRLVVECMKKRMKEWKVKEKQDRRAAVAALDSACAADLSELRARKAALTKARGALGTEKVIGGACV
jgi:hypothetical protein